MFHCHKADLVHLHLGVNGEHSVIPDSASQAIAAAAALQILLFNSMSRKGLLETVELR